MVAPAHSEPLGNKTLQACRTIRRALETGDPRGVTGAQDMLLRLVDSGDPEVLTLLVTSVQLTIEVGQASLKKR